MSRYFLVALMCVLVSPVFPHELLITEAALATSPEEHISHFPNGHDEVKAEATTQLPVSETIDAAAIDHGDLLDFFGTNKKKQQKAADRAYQGYLHQQHASKDQDVQHQLKVWMGILIGALVISFTLNAVSAFFYHQEMSTPIPVVTAMDPSTQILSSPIGTPNALPSNQSFLPSGGVSVIRCM